MEAMNPSEASVITYKAAWRHNPKAMFTLFTALRTLCLRFVLFTKVVVVNEEIR
jgi:hypothetical protein